MALKFDTQGYEATRAEIMVVDPRALVVNWKNNLSRGCVEPPVDDELIALARDMIPKPSTGPNDGENGSTGQLNPVLGRKLPDQRVEVVGGFRRLRAALWLIESGECPDFRIKVDVRAKMNDSEAALINISENMNRLNPEPMQMAHAIRSLHEDFQLTLTAIAGRLKISQQHLSTLLSLTGLESDIQKSIADGETTITAGAALAKLDGPTQKEVFNAAKAAGGRKVKVADINKVKADKHEAGETTGPVKRTLKDFISFFESKTGPAEDEVGRKLANLFLDYRDGKRNAEKKLLAHWELCFPAPSQAEDAPEAEAAPKKSKKAS